MSESQPPKREAVLYPKKSIPMKSPLNKSSQNILLFSLFLALYIFQSKMAFTAGAQIISFQIQTGLSALAALSLVMLPNVFREMRVLLRENPKLFWQLVRANGLHYGIGGTLYIIGVSLTSEIFGCDYNISRLDFLGRESVVVFEGCHVAVTK